MIKPPPPKATGIAGLVLLFCTVAVVAGIGFDVTSTSGRLSLLAQPGARAVLGVAVAVAASLAAHALRFALGRKIAHTDEAGGGSGNHP